MYKDKPIEKSEEDLLNRADFSNSLGDAILKWRHKESWVIALTGDWGIGKTSVKNLVVNRIKTTNQDIVIVDSEHLIFMREYANELRPYVHVRFGINALIQRHTFFHLIEYGELLENAQGETILTLQSGDLHLQLGT